MPGASSIDMEKMVALPVEEALNELEDIKHDFIRCERWTCSCFGGV